MQSLQRQNSMIQRQIEDYLDDIQKQKELNAQHQMQIQTLLKFNERLLGIIENKLNNNRKERVSLQAISERSERESDLIVGTAHSLIKARKFAPKSQRGSATSNSLIQRNTFAGGRLDSLARELRSQLNHSSQDEASEYKNEFHQPPSPILTPLKNQASQSVQAELKREIQHLRQLKAQGSRFYDNKISEIKHLSTKLTTFQPLQHLNHINQRLNISQSTALLLQRMLTKH